MHERQDCNTVTARITAVLSSIALVMFGPAGCQDAADDPAAGWTLVDREAMTDDQRAQKDRALIARDAMFSQLSTTLFEQLAMHGPGPAITVCQEEAPRIAQTITEEHDLLIGRTSHRLRNPSNTSPAWGASLLESRIEGPAFLTGPNDRLGAWLPIHLQSACLMCHGSADQIPPSVTSMIAERYPDDEATGFTSGELRGWFWIEVGPS